MTFKLAAEQLSMDRGISIDDALARMERQDRLESIAAAFEARSETSAGAYLDQDRGGDLVVLDTDSEGARLLATKQFPADNVIVQSARWSTRDLLMAAKSVFDRGEFKVGDIVFSSDVRSNRVSVSVNPEFARFDDVVRAVTEVSGGATDPPIMIEPVDRTLQPTACQTGYMLCSAPLRGGVGMIAGTEICTAGFNVQSRSDARKYVLTAGHCTAGSETYSTEFADGRPHEIGDAYYSTTIGSDVGLVDLTNPPGWNPQWWILVRASRGYPPTTEDTEYDITSTGSSTVSSYLCKGPRENYLRVGRVRRVGLGAMS